MYDPVVGRPVHLVDAADLLRGLHLGGVAVWRWRVDTDELLWTDNLHAVHGASFSAYDGTLETFQHVLHPDDAKPTLDAVSEAVAKGTPFCVVYRTRPRPDGSVRWIETRGGLVTEDGATWLTGTSLDVTDRIEAEQELQRRLKQQKAVEELGSFAINESSFQAVVDRAAKVAAEVLEVPFTHILQLAGDGTHLRLIAGVGWREGLIGTATVNAERGSQAGYTILEGRPVVVENLAAETRFSIPKLLRSHGVVSGITTIIAGDGGRAFGIFGAHANVRRCFDKADVDFLSALANIVASSARHIAAAEHRKLLVREMAHRAGNMLQLVDTLARRAFLPGRSLEEAQQAFSSRLASLARANSFIAKGGWSMTQFSALAWETLEPFRDHVRFSGAEVLLPPELCFDLGLVLHELSTNSVKYGSFAAGQEGTVDIIWSVSTESAGRERFHLEWRDESSPASAAPEPGTGFGSRLVRLIIEQKYGGHIEPASGPFYRFAFSLPLPSDPGALTD